MVFHQWCSSPKNIKQLALDVSHTDAFSCLLVQSGASTCAYFIAVKLCSIAIYIILCAKFNGFNTMLLYERIGDKLLVRQNMAEEPWKSSASEWSVRFLTQSMMLGKYLVTSTTGGWEGWETCGLDHKGMIRHALLHLYPSFVSRHESYDHADGVAHDDHGRSNRCTCLGFIRTYERATRPNLNPSGPVSRWFYFLLCNSCCFAGDWMFQVCFMMLLYCECEVNSAYSIKFDKSAGRSQHDAFLGPLQWSRMQVVMR